MNPMTTITIIRHAEAEGNYYRRAHGQYNSLLTENGKAQLAALRRRFQDTRFDEIYSSDLYRAYQTASVLRTAGGTPPRAVPALREIHLGAWEDEPWGELALSDAQNFYRFTKEPWRFERQGPGGESMSEAQARVLSAVRGIARAHRGGHVAVATHGMVIRTLLAGMTGAAAEGINDIAHCDNASVGCVRWDGERAPEVLFLGDNTHLGDLSTLGRQGWWRKDDRVKDTNLWFAPAEIPRDLPATLSYREEAWLSVYGSMMGFSPDITNAQTARMAAAHPMAVVFAMRDTTPVGLLELDVEAVTPDNTGHISLVYLTPQERGRELGAQLIGQAVSVYRKLGRRALHLRVAESNKAARRFYAKLGFAVTAREEGMFGQLLVMKLDIAVPG